MLSLPKENPHLGSWVGKFLWSVAGFPWYHVDVAVSFTFIPLWYRNIWPQKIGMPRPNELLVMKANVWAPDSVANGNSTSDGGNGKGQIHPSKMNENGKKRQFLRFVRIFIFHAHDEHHTAFAICSVSIEWFSLCANIRLIVIAKAQNDEKRKHMKYFCIEYMVLRSVDEFKWTCFSIINEAAFEMHVIRTDSVFFSFSTEFLFCEFLFFTSDS